MPPISKVAGSDVGGDGLDTFLQRLKKKAHNVRVYVAVPFVVLQLIYS